MSEFDEILKEYLIFRKNAQNKSDKTVNLDRIKLTKVYEHLKSKGIDWKKPTEKGILEFLSQYKEGNTFNSYLVHISVFYKWYLRLDEKPDFLKRISHRTKRQMMRTKKYIQKRQRIITNEEYQQMQNITHNIRDKAILELLYQTGIRREELLSMTNQSIDITDNDIVYITVFESKTETRRIPVSKHKLPLTEEYYLRYYPFKDKTEEYSLFYNQHNPRKHLSISTPNKIIERIAKRAGIQRTVSPHDFRHTAITRDCKTTMPRSLIETYYGLVKGSQQFKTYDHTDIEDIAQYIKENNTEKAPHTISQLEKQNQDIKSNYENRLKELENRLDKYAEIIKMFSNENYYPQQNDTRYNSKGEYIGKP